jgi:transcriptional regulator with XRE-family HTH domain
MRTVRDAQQIGKRLEVLLKERYPGMPRRRICEEAGVSYKTLSDALSGKTVPRYGTAERLADYLGVTVNYLYTGDEDEPVIESDEDRLRAIERQIHDLTAAIDRLRDQVSEDSREAP